MVDIELFPQNIKKTVDHADLLEILIDNKLELHNMPIDLLEWAQICFLSCSI